MKNIKRGEIQIPKNWTQDAWVAFNKKMERMTKEELLKAFGDLGLFFHESEERLTKDDVIAVADELREKDVREYFKV